MNTLFHRFRPHETVTFLAYEREGRRMTYRNSEGLECNSIVQAFLSIDLDGIAPGTTLGVQFGEASGETSRAMGGTRFIRIGRRTVVRQVYAGCHCITAIRHPDPRVLLTTARMMDQAFGRDQAIAHLERFGAGASTLQMDIEPQRERYSRSRPQMPLSGMKVEKGILTAEMALAPDVILNGRVLRLVKVELPDAVLAALPGRRAWDVVNHPVLQGDETVVEEAWMSGETIFIRIGTPVLTPKDAIDTLGSPLARAA